MLGEKETWKYLGILEAYSIKRVEMKDKIQKEYLRKLPSYSIENYETSLKE